MGNDPRFKYTEMVLRTNFIQLMSEIGYEKLTVTKLINNAKINRTTFYSHYQDKADLLDTLESKLLDGILEVAQALPAEIFLHAKGDLDTPEIVQQINLLCNYLHSQGQFLSLLLDPIKGDRDFSNKLTETLRTSWSKNRILPRLVVPEEYALSVMTAMFSSMISQWVQRNFQESSEEFAEITLKIVKSLSQGLVN